jgi:hypothetical protein
MKYPELKWLVLLITALAFNSSNAETPEVCEAIKKEKYVPFSGAKYPPVMYLTDKTGNIVKGPIDLGIYAYKYEPRDFFTIRISYKLVVFPKKILLRGSGEGIMGLNVSLIQSKAICPDSRTYTITYQHREAPTKERSQSFTQQMPYRIDDGFATSSFEDPSLEGETYVDPVCRFDCRFVGTIVDGNKKQP